MCLCAALLASPRLLLPACGLFPLQFFFFATFASRRNENSSKFYQNSCKDPRTVFQPAAVSCVGTPSMVSVFLPFLCYYYGLYSTCCTTGGPWRAPQGPRGGGPACGMGTCGWITGRRNGCDLTSLLLYVGQASGQVLLRRGPRGARPLNLHACRVPTRRAGDGEEAAKPAMGRRFLFPGKRVTTAGVTAASHGNGAGMMIL